MTSIAEVYRRWPDKGAAIVHLEQVRWPHGPECVYCNETTVARHAEGGQTAIACEMIDPRTSVVTTDEYSGYNRLNHFVAHRIINHSVSFVEWDMFAGQYGPTHTNTIESFWAIVKRAIVGQVHHVSRKYLPLYLRELSYRYNLRHGPINVDGVLHLAVKP